MLHVQEKRNFFPCRLPTILKTFTLLTWGCFACSCTSSPNLRTETLQNQFRDLGTEKISAINSAAAFRLYDRLPLGSKERIQLRAELVDFLSIQARDMCKTENFASMIEVFAKFADLYFPKELETETLPKAWVQLAKKIYAWGKEQGDEARTLAALRLLIATHTKEKKEQYIAQYNHLLKWIKQSRATIEDPLKRNLSLIEIWQEFLRLFPGEDVLETLALFQLDQRQLLYDFFNKKNQKNLEDSNPLSSLKLNGPVFVVEQTKRAIGLFLQFEQYDKAINFLNRIPGGKQSGPIDDARLSLNKVFHLIEKLKNRNKNIDDDLAALTKEFLRQHIRIAKGLSKTGLRRFPKDFRFPLYMARIAGAQKQVLDSVAWYREAIRLAPKEKWVYDEALEAIQIFLAQGLLDTHHPNSKGLADQADVILSQRIALEKGNDAELPISIEKLHYMVAKIEMNAGHLDAAIARLKRSLAQKKMISAFQALAFIQLQTGNYASSVSYFQQALDLLENHAETLEDTSGFSLIPKSHQTLPQKLLEASLRKDLGESLFMLGDPKRAKQAFEEALLLVEEIEKNSSDPNILSEALIDKAILFDRLGQHKKTTETFFHALQANPYNENAYASILSYLVKGNPNATLAFEVWIKMQTHLALKPEWKVYFALWVQAIFTRANQKIPEPVLNTLKKLSNHTEWWGSLAGLGAGIYSHAQLMKRAKNTGEIAEAHFYESVRQLKENNSKVVRDLLQKVIQTQMINFYEYTMARQWLFDLQEEKQGQPTAQE